MDERTLIALKGSIEKWRGIVAGYTRDEGAVNCPFRDFVLTTEGTPYKLNPHQVDAAKAELAFLESLLPPEEPTK